MQIGLGLSKPLSKMRATKYKREPLLTTFDHQVPDPERFMTKYSMQCPMAITRLIQSGVPATIEHGR